jgi:hypothetical protein
MRLNKNNKEEWKSAIRIDRPRNVGDDGERVGVEETA